VTAVPSGLIGPAMVAVFAAPLAAASLGLLGRRSRLLQRLLALAALLVALASALLLVVATRAGAAHAVDVGGWPGGLAIVLGVDGLSALMLTVGALMTLLGSLFAAASGEDEHPLFHPLVLALWTGAALAFVTADLFNLFVAFEVMLAASYVLLTLRGGRAQIRAGVLYVGVNLAASTLFLLGVALLYAATGTVNLAGLAVAVPGDPAALAGLAVLLIAVVAKAAIVPLHGWLPRTYVHAGPAVTAIFSALLSKAGVYVLYRLTATILADLRIAAPILLAAALLTMVVGVLGAVGGEDMRGILTFHMVSQVGYLILPLGLWTVGMVAAGLLYLLQYIAVKGALLMVAAAVVRLHGTDRLAALGGLLRSRPALGVAFLLPALALAGLPPTSGFLGKLLLVREALGLGAWVAAGVAVAVSLLTLLSMIKILTGAFWGEPAADAPPVPPAPSAARGRAMLAVPLAIGLATVAIGLVPGPLVTVVGEAARALVDPTAFLTAIAR